jgi:hypothetical protein
VSYDRDTGDGKGEIIGARLTTVLPQSLYLYPSGIFKKLSSHLHRCPQIGKDLLLAIVSNP